MTRGLMGSALGFLAQHPVGSLGAVVATGFTVAVVVNTLFMQTGPHPAPLLANTVLAEVPRETTGSLRPVAQPIAASPQDTAAAAPAAQPARSRAELLTLIQRELAGRGYYAGGIDGIYGPQMDSAIREFEQAAGRPVTGEPSEALLKALIWSTLNAEETRAAGARAATARSVPTPPSRRIVAVQRALTDFGYGQVGLTGVLDDTTRVAIERFERQRRLPVRGQISDRLVRELAAVTGRPLE